VHPFVAVKEPEHFTSVAEVHSFRRPREADPVASFAARCEDHGLPERPKRHRHLQHDATILEFAQRSQMGSGAVAQRLDHDLVVPGAGQPVEDAPRLGVRKPCQLAADDHPPESSYARVIESIVSEL